LSHIVTVQTKIHDPAAVTATCRRLQLAPPVMGSANLYSGEATGLVLHFPGWEYPVVIDPLTGTITYDNFNGAWGDPGQLQRFRQAYAVEKAKLEASKRGHLACPKSSSKTAVSSYASERAIRISVAHSLLAKHL
jgi:hypothetical protein